MSYRQFPIPSVFLILLQVLVFSCHQRAKTVEKDIVKKPAQMEEHVSDDLKKMLELAADHQGKLNDSSLLNYNKLLDSIYQQNKYTAFWSDKEHWLTPGDSLFAFIEHSKEYGLFPSDYHYQPLAFIHRVMAEDSIARKNAALWARADLLLTDAFFTLAKHLKQGRLKYDSVTQRTDSILGNDFYTSQLQTALRFDSVGPTLHALEPKYKGYDSLKAGLKDFLASARWRKLTWLEYPYKDSLTFFHLLARRLQEVGYVDSSIVADDLDSVELSKAIRSYQHANGLKPSGKVSEAVVNMMDNSDWEKFKRIAINLDRYKLLPDTLPTTYVWVNLPAFRLQVINADTVVLESRIIVGAPKTRTPLLTSEISNFITFPQWTVPTSIIFKEMLPKIKENIDYLRKQNLMVVNDRDSVLDPQKIRWARLNKNNFPYQLRQRQGDDNSLGVMKFNFRNKYDVYLHDTNARWLFGQSFRALSHGCVRVKEFQKLADFLIRNDSTRFHPDTVRAWIKRQEKHTVYGFRRVPIFLRYFTCEAQKGKILFHQDIYGEDKQIRAGYFADKPIY